MLDIDIDILFRKKKKGGGREGDMRGRREARKERGEAGGDRV